MVSIVYYTELNVQICNYAQIQRICNENSKNALDESFYGHFCPRRNVANFCHPGRPNAPAVQCLRSLVLSYHMYDFENLVIFDVLFLLWIVEFGIFCINVFLYEKDLRVKSCYACSRILTQQRFSFGSTIDFSFLTDLINCDQILAAILSLFRFKHNPTERLKFLYDGLRQSKMRD